MLDGITQAISKQELSSNDGDEIGRFFKLLPRGIARTHGAAVLLVDHVTKSNEDRGRYAIGSQQKLAAIDGVQFSPEVITRSGVVRTDTSRSWLARTGLGIHEHTPSGPCRCSE